MVLMEELLDYGAEHAVCALTIRRDSLFCEGVNGVPSWVGIEYMAQTAGAHAGLSDATEGRPAGICMYLGTKRYRSERTHFAIGSRLRVVVQLVLRDDSDLTAFDCAIYQAEGDGENVIARGDIKAFRPKDLDAIMRGARI